MKLANPRWGTRIPSTSIIGTCRRLAVALCVVVLFGTIGGARGAGLDTNGGAENPAGKAVAAEASPLKLSESMQRLDASVRLLFNGYMRDPSICLGPDGTYYLTGTTEGQNSIRLWKSKDLKNWEKLDFEWRYGGSPWHKPYKDHGCPLWAPEVHYKKGTFWLTYSMPTYTGEFKDSGSGLLKSTTGKPEGPYADVSPNERLGDEIDASLFEDVDGTLYFVWHCGKIRKLKPDLSGPAEPVRKLHLSVSDPDPSHHSTLCLKIHGANSFDHIGYEGVFLFRIGDTYMLSAADHYDGKYTAWLATSKNIYGPYSARYPAIPNGGHNMYFKDTEGQWWATIFNGPVTEKPAIVPLNIEANGQITLREAK
jgi:xylan 1,4-beta-xylosidase